jgi:uncharacterized membrane protein YGL010W
MTRLDALLADYGSYHRTRGNLVCHAVGVTLIVYGVLAMLGRISLAGTSWTAAEALIVVAFFFYLKLSAPLALTMLAESVALDFVAHGVADWRVGLAAFAVGWIFQGVGHARYEKNAPAFFKNLLHLLVGPIFLWNEVLRVKRIGAR